MTAMTILAAAVVAPDAFVLAVLTFVVALPIGIAILVLRGKLSKGSK